MDEKIKYILNVFIFCLLIVALINILANHFNFDFDKIISDSVTIEGLEQNIATGARAFCDLHIGSSSILNGSCGKLTEKNCNETSCCVFTNNKCVAGNAKGPTYNNGNTSTSNYYYQNQCYGTNCPMTQSV